MARRLRVTLPTLCRLVLLQVAVVLAEANVDTTPRSICLPFGECEPCPRDALHEPFCQPFGNRRLMHCTPEPASTSPSWYPNPTDTVVVVVQGETPAWQSCGRIVEHERADFYEFVGYNLFVVAVAVGVALVRSRTVEARQARRLAARIGLTRV